MKSPLLPPHAAGAAEDVRDATRPQQQVVEQAWRHPAGAGTAVPWNKEPLSGEVVDVQGAARGNAVGALAGPVSAAAAVAADSLPDLDDPLAAVNMLHKVLVSTGLHADLGLPQIAVVGSQSVGKTSVLQSLVGRDFLPRGSGIVTRRPLVLQLHAIRPGAVVGSGDSGGAGGVDVVGDGGAPEWAEFEHRPGERFVDFDRVRGEIERETERVCGDNCGISDEPIILKIFSQSVMDLTLVDLPGLTKVPTGDQPEDIPQRIRGLVLRYVSQPSCLILAVSAASTDLATSDALALAREVDRDGERTLGVLTKLDVADESGGAMEALQGRLYPLRLGYVGVVCRSKSASRADAAFNTALRREEREFLRQSKAFRHVADKCGIAYLARRLHELLLQHIRETLPDLRTRVQGMANKSRQELALLGDPGQERRMGQGSFLLHLLSRYARNFVGALEGGLTYSLPDKPPDRLVGGARLHHIFHRVFAQAVFDFDAFSGISDLEIRVAMRNAAGPKPQLFVPEVAFEALVKRQIQKLEDPSLQCVHFIYEELKHLASQSEGPEMQRFPGLREKVLEVAHGVIRQCLQPTNRAVSNLIRIELAHINVDHPDFIGGVRAMSRVQESTCQHPQPLQARQARSPQECPAEDADARDGGTRADVEDPALVCSRPAPAAIRPALECSAAHRTACWIEPRRPSGADDALRLPAVPLVVTPSGEVSEKERMDMELLKSLVSSYHAIVKRKIADAVPKTIMHFMVNAACDRLHHECVAGLYNRDLFATLLREGEDVRGQRLRCEKRLAELRQAQDILVHACDAASQM